MHNPITILMLTLPTAGLLFLARQTLCATSLGRRWLCPRRNPAAGPKGIRRPGRWASVVTLAFILLDWALVAALPRLGLSYGPVTSYVLILAAVRIGLLVLVLLVQAGQEIASLRQNDATAEARRRRGTLALLWAGQLLILGLMIDASYIEPFAVGVSEVELAPVDLSLERPLRILHLTDIHVERTSPREREVAEIAQRLAPDLILLTGDYLNIANLSGPAAVRDLRSLLGQLQAPLGVYAVNGNVESPARLRDLVRGIDITVLDDEAYALPMEGGALYLVGISIEEGWRDEAALQRVMEEVPPEAYTVLLYHTPDLIETAAAEGVDLYLAGHTHGGQVRLPSYGAVVTASRYGKAYEQGRYSVGPTTLYVSRGLGMEGFWLTPRVRFLCPPEVVLLTLE